MTPVEARVVKVAGYMTKADEETATRMERWG
jgi:hypothetical protein